MYMNNGEVQNNSCIIPFSAAQHKMELENHERDEEIKFSKKKCTMVAFF
jgi:hypothetical protein